LRYLIACATIICSIGGASDAKARGVTPYLPLKMAPGMERQIERVLIMAGQPAMRRPIPAALVLDALPEACKRDRDLCIEVSRYLQRFMRTSGITSLRAEGTASFGDSLSTLPNAHGRTVESVWNASAGAYFQPNDFMLASLGAVAYSDNATPTGTMISLGFDFAQLDVGFRDHWFSPMYESSSLISTQAPTMASITLSNYQPISPLGISYEIFAAEMSNQEGIAIVGGTTSGRPRLAGIQAGLQPVEGYGLAASRVFQYGGGARQSGGFSAFADALFKNSHAISNNPDSEFGNQAAAITSSLAFPGRVPFAVRLEYAGEDNAYATGYRLGAINFTMGIDLPQLWETFDATVEISEWQNDWYTHHLYPNGLSNRGHVIGHWFGDEREPGNAIGGSSQTARIGWSPSGGGYWQAKYRTIAYDGRWSRGQPVPPYSRAQSLEVNWSSNWRGIPFELQANVGRDIFGENFARLNAAVDFMDYVNFRREVSIPERDVPEEEDDVDLFVETGANRSAVVKLLVIGQPAPPILSTYGVHAGIGARRKVTERGDLSARIEFDEVEGYSLISFRALDYRYRITRKIAASGFLGFGRYDVELPAYGYYWGLGAQYMDVFPRWDIGFDLRHYEKLSRDKTLPTDPPASAEGHPRMYFDVDSMSLYVSYRW
jgi:hypothetical protein